MLSLDSPKWSELEHAFGSANDIPTLLRHLEENPSIDGKDEPWFSLFSSLVHQGDIYSASFAAVPHVVRIFSQTPTQVGSSCLKFLAYVEISRQDKSVPIPAELETEYLSALKQLPYLVAQASEREWTADFLTSALSAIAAAKGFGKFARAIMQLAPEVVDEFLRWISTW